MTARTSYRLALLPGDGIGPEVVAQAMRVLDVCQERWHFTTERREMPWSSEHYLKTGALQDRSHLKDYDGFDAIFLGAIGDPRAPVGVVEKATILTLRFGLDLYINLRPIKLYHENLCPLKGKTPEHLDMIVVRENTEDAYSQLGGVLREGTAQELSITNMVNTYYAAERACRFAFELARKRGKKKKVTLVDKANAIPTHATWQRAFREVGERFPDIERDHAYVDAACMWLVKNPEWFDVIVTTNLFGDILTDLGGMLVGGMALGASANLHPGRISLFEPVHGSAPKYAGQNRANPLAAILTLVMMLDFLGQREAAQGVELAIAGLLESGRIRDVSAASGLKTDEIGGMVCDALG